MCNPTVYEGLWITHYDMVENGDKIDIVDKGQVCTADTQRSMHLQPHCAGRAAATNPMISSLSSAALGAGHTSCGTTDSSTAAACNSWQVTSSVCISGVPASGMAASLLVYNLLRCLVCLACAWRVPCRQARATASAPPLPVPAARSVMTWICQTCLKHYLQERAGAHCISWYAMNRAMPAQPGHLQYLR